MQPLIDLDILFYEIGFGAEYSKDGVVSFETVAKMFDNKIEEICENVEATEPPILYYTGKENFRNEIARKKEYKGNRKDAKKPVHYSNIKAYATAVYDCRMQEGLEADDLLCIEQTLRTDNNTIICSRDKDLRQCRGWHYTWECGKQPELSPYFVEGMGEINLIKKGKTNKLEGNGLMFMYSQMLTGDSVDNIPGLKGYGPVRVHELLRDCQTDVELYRVCLDEFKEMYPENAPEELLEQARLVYMVKELDTEGNPVMYYPPEDDLPWEEQTSMMTSQEDTDLSFLDMIPDSADDYVVEKFDDDGSDDCPDGACKI